MASRYTLKFVALFFLVVQATSLVIQMRYTRTKPGPMYLSSTAVFFVELTKLCMCIGLLAHEKGTDGALVELRDNLLVSETFKVLIPSFLYTIQNNLLYYALSNLDPATYQVVYQLKVLTTAWCAWIILKKQISNIKWVALVLLFLGVAMVSVDLEAPPARQGLAVEQHPFWGLMAILVACLTSGFAGVYFEKIVKSSAASIWLRNIPLAIFGMCTSVVIILTRDFVKIRENGVFYGYNGMVWGVIFNQACGGLIVAVVVKYADNILKGFAMAISIILSSLLSIYMFEFVPTLLFVVGAIVVVGSVFLYNKDDGPKVEPKVPIPLHDKSSSKV